MARWSSPTDHVETKEHVGGFIILKAANLDEALEWGRKGAVACRAPVETARFLSGPEDNQHIPGIGRTERDQGVNRVFMYSHPLISLATTQ